MNRRRSSAVTNHSRRRSTFDESSRKFSSIMRTDSIESNDSLPIIGGIITIHSCIHTNMSVGGDRSRTMSACSENILDTPVAVRRHSDSPRSSINYTIVDYEKYVHITHTVVLVVCFVCRGKGVSLLRKLTNTLRPPSAFYAQYAQSSRSSTPGRELDSFNGINYSLLLLYDCKYKCRFTV